MPETLRIEYTKAEDGVSIAWTSIGQGPPLVLASSHNGDINMYASGVTWTDLLTDSGRKVVFYDARGSGSSDRQVTDFGLEPRVADLKAVIDKAGPEPVALFGRSHGGLAAVAYAARYPEKLTHLVLWDAFINGAEYFEATSYTRAIVAISEMATADWEFFTLTLAHWGLGFKAPDVAMSMAKGIRNGISAQSYLSAIEGAKSIDVSALLPQVSVPTLVVVDQTNVLAVPDAGRALASAIPGAQFVSVRGPRRTTDAVIEFISPKPEPEPHAPPAAFLGHLVQDIVRDAEQAREAITLRTVLFTDLVGHTEMMQRLGDEAGRNVLREHERITREVLKANGGTEVKTMGDGFMASFASVTRAVECAIALQQAIHQRNESRAAHPEEAHSEAEGRLEGLEVRIGLNAGEPIQEDGDLFGATVILASRIAANANGGEILVADTVRGLCSGKGFLFSDRGEFIAKGFEDPVRIYEVNWQ